MWHRAVWFHTIVWLLHKYIYMLSSHKRKFCWDYYSLIQLLWLFCKYTPVYVSSSHNWKLVETIKLPQLGSVCSDVISFFSFTNRKPYIVFQKSTLKSLVLEALTRHFFGGRGNWDESRKAGVYISSPNFMSNISCQWYSFPNCLTGGCLLNGIAHCVTNSNSCSHLECEQVLTAGSPLEWNVTEGRDNSMLWSWL